MRSTPNLTNEFHPVPKPTQKTKKLSKPIQAGKKTQNWNDGREDLKKQFSAWGITDCEIGPALSKIAVFLCKKDNFLGFAHTRRRVKLSPGEVRDPRFVVLACQPCHQYVDFEMPREEAEVLLDSIVTDRQKRL